MLAAAQDRGAETPELTVIVNRMVQAEAASHDAATSYSVTRQYDFYSDKPQPDAKVVADIQYVPPDKKDFAITSSKGSGRGERVVRKVLEHESQMASRWQETAVTPDNYDFAFERKENLDGHLCYVLALKPKRDTKELLHGEAWVDAQSFRIRKIAGEPVKNPSWWIKKLSLVLLFADVEGMWMQTAAHAVADVRFFGKSELTARDIACRRLGSDAKMRIPRRDFGRAEMMSGAAVLRYK